MGDAVSGGTLAEIAAGLFADGKGLLAIDESTATCNTRFAARGIPQTEDARRTYRELIVTTPGLAASISGVILYDETLRQRTLAGRLFVDVLADAGIVTGIKVDTGAKVLAGRPGETVTEGLDGLRGRLQDYRALGARFAKWRAVIALSDGAPSRGCIDANAHALARYAALCQEAAIVPVVEAEVLMEGDHSLDRSRAATEDMLRAVFAQLHAQGVALDSIILKPNMVLPGLACTLQPGVTEIADATLGCFMQVIPAAIAGIAFLSGGQSAQLASVRLNAINLKAREPGSRVPWPLSFSFARAIQQPALDIWRGNEAQVGAAQAALSRRAGFDRLARRGEYHETVESADA